MELVTRSRMLAASLIAAGGLALFGCGGGGESEPTEPKSDVATAEIEENTRLVNYKIVKLAEFEHGEGISGQNVTTYEESYDFNGLRWVCSLTLSNGGRQGGPAKSCVTTPTEKPTG